MIYLRSTGKIVQQLPVRTTNVVIFMLFKIILDVFLDYFRIVWTK